MAERQPDESSAVPPGEAGNAGEARGRRADRGDKRTAAEREAARLERQRRRAGGDWPAEPPLPEPEPAQPVRSQPASAHLPTGHTEEPATVRGVADVVLEDPDEVPAGTRRVSALQRKPGSTRPVRRRSTTPITGRRHSVRGRAAGVLAIFLAIALIWFLVQLFQPFHGAGHGSVTVTIPPKSGVSQIGDLLQHDGVIASSFFFGLRATLAGNRGDLYAGTYHLKLGMPYGKVLSILTTPPPAAKVTNITLIEGRTRRQIDFLLRHQGIRGSYASASRRSRLLDPHRYGAPRRTPSLEGFLFPSTYQLREPISVSSLVADQLKQFRKVFAGVNLSAARRHHLTPYDVLIIASMVEAESQTEHDRRDVASVIYNRLAQQMPLQVDATTRYATGNYSAPLTVSQLQSNSPYNTRIRPGLPPTPIDNPGLASIEAAANPPRTNFLYFVVRPCGNGQMTFTGSYQQFLADAARYQQARAARGGRSPAHC